MTNDETGVRQENIDHLYLALRAIRKVDQLLIKTKDRSKLIQGICDSLVRNRSYYNAWIVLVDESRTVTETAEAGLGDEFLPMAEQLEACRFTLCATQAMTSDRVVVIEDPYTFCTDCPLSEKYSGRSAMTVRLEHDGKIFGLLCVSIPKKYAADEEELELLREIAGDIAFGLNKIALEEALVENEERFRDLVEHTPTGILIVQDDTVMYRNPEQERISGHLHRPGDSFELLHLHPDDEEKVRSGFSMVGSGAKKIIDMDFRFYPSGNTDSRLDMKWGYCRASVINYRGRDAILVNMIDMTRAKELEQALLVKDKMVSLGHIAAGIAHEIRNPLSGINIYLNTLEQMLAGSDEPETVKKIFGQLQSASRKIESIIKRVIDFSKPSEPKFVEADVNQPIEEAVKLSAVTIRKSGVRLEKSLAEELPGCLIDPTLIEEVILNLINNATEAMKNMEGEKKIEVRSERRNDHVLISVSDSGPGVPSAIRKRFFNHFYTTKNDSTGIGLSLCHRIVTDHGGTLDVRRSRWSGAEFQVRLPVVNSEPGKKAPGAEGA